MEWITVLAYAPYALPGAFCLFSGYALGTRHARAMKRRVLRNLNAQSLELLDTKVSLNSLKHYASQQERKDRLLKLALKKLQAAEARCRHMNENLTKQHRKYFVDTSRLRLDAMQSRETAIKAAQIARRATARLQRLEQASPAAQSIVAPEPRSHGAGEPVMVSVVEQARQETPGDNVIPVSKRNTARLTQLQNSHQSRTSRA